MPSPGVVEATHDLLRWAVPAIGKFPRNFRFTLGERIENRIYGLLERLIRAQYTDRRERSVVLRDCNIEIAILRHEFRIAHELNVLSFGQIEFVSRLLVDIGRQVGGWEKSLVRAGSSTI